MRIILYTLLARVGIEEVIWGRGGGIRFIFVGYEGNHIVERSRFHRIDGSVHS